jgi:hypothetical protein
MDRTNPKLAWRKSSYSGGSGDNCVEVAHTPEGGIAVRDSKDPDGGTLKVTFGDWQSFIASVKKSHIN